MIQKRDAQMLILDQKLCVLQYIFGPFCSIIDRVKEFGALCQFGLMTAK